MTDEELAEDRATKFADINFNKPDNYGSTKEVGHFSYYTGFFAGLEAGRPKWHKVADGDFPKEGVEVLDKDGDKVIYDAGGSQGWIAYSEYCGRYVEVDEPIAWCEIPKYIEK